MNRETRIGLFVVIAGLVFAFFILRMQDDGFGNGLFNRTAAQELRVVLDDASGIREGTAVRIAGVQVGKVERLVLENGQAIVILKIPKDIVVPADSIVELRTQGVLGERFVALIIGSGPAPTETPTLRGQTPISLDNITATLNEIGQEVLALTKSLKESTVDPNGENRLSAIVANIERLTQAMAQTMEMNQGHINQTLANVSQLSGDMRSDIPALVAEMKALAEELKGMAQQNRGNIDGTMARVHSISEKLDKTMDSLNSVAQKVDSGKGVIGKLINDDATGQKLDELIDSANSSLKQLDTVLGQANKIDLELGFRVDYLQEHEGSISTFQLRLVPSGKKYYLIEAFSRDTDYFPKEFREINETTFDAEGNVISRSQTLEPKEPKTFGFGGQLAYRFGDVFLRGGLIEGDGGAGVDWMLFKDKAKFSFEAFDFSRPDDLNPRARLNFEYGLGGGFNVRLGWDDLLESKYDSAMLGLSLRWKDPDLKPLLSSLGSLAR
ncbi:MAG: MCE family protein [Acidobacteria bacterium]|nr:MCE family protein [Acidobacteriota bacterium]